MPPRKKSTKKAAPLPLPAHFIQDSWILSDPPEVLPFLEMAQLGEEVRRIDGEMAIHVMWLREQRDFCTKVGRQHGIRLPTSRNSAFGELGHYTVPLAREEPVDPEGLPESLEEDVSSERDTIKKREEKPTAPVATPRSRPLLRQSQIKPEITSPEAQPPVPASPAKSLHNAAARPLPKVPGRPQLSHYPVSKLQPEKKKDGTSYAFEARIEEATRRKQEQLEKMVEKTRKGNEAKERRVQENLEKIEKKRLEDLQKAEIQQKLAASRSPSRSRLANTATTPTRFKSPARPVLPTPKFISRAKLFDEPPRSVRTPERPHSKQPRMDQLLSAVRSSPAHPSPMRQVARKVPVSTTRKETMKPPKKQAQPSDDALDPQFIENQRRLLMEDEEKTRLREEVRRRLEEEEEKKRREEDERRRIEEKERLREEQERLRMEEERRRVEENEQAIGPQSPAQDISMEEDGGSDVDAYEMTQDKIFIPSTAENYHIEDLDSGDETDDECAPRKKVPVWAEWDNLYKTATAQYSKPNVNYDDMFGTMDNPHNQPIFDNTKMTKRRPRGSSAQWNSPASNPTKGKSRFLGY